MEARCRLPSIDEGDGQDATDTTQPPLPKGAATTEQLSMSLSQVTVADAIRPQIEPQSQDVSARRARSEAALEAQPPSDKPALRSRARSQLLNEAAVPPALATPAQLEALTDSQLAWSCLRIDDDESTAPWVYTGSIPNRLARLAIVAVAVLAVTSAAVICELTQTWVPSTQRHTTRWRDQVNAQAARWMVLPAPASKAPSHL